MSLRETDLNERRRELASAIARQRGELANAYRDLARPLQYAESGLRGLTFLRQNPWIFSVVPAAFTISSAVVGMVRGKPSLKLSRAEKWRGEEERAARLEKKASKSLGSHALKWGMRGWKLFRLYGKLRKHIS